jgi:putative transposase
VVSLAERRRCETYLRNAHEVSERRACQEMQLNRSSYCHVGVQEPVDGRHARVVRLSQRYPCWGYRKIHALLKADRNTV